MYTAQDMRCFTEVRSSITGGELENLVVSPLNGKDQGEEVWGGVLALFTPSLSPCCLTLCSRAAAMEEPQQP